MVVVNQLEGIAKRWRYKRDNIIFSHKHLTFSRYRFICLEKKKNECLEKKKRSSYLCTSLSVFIFITKEFSFDSQPSNNKNKLKVG